MITENADIFRERLRAARELRKLSQAELALAAKLPTSSIAHFESGARKPSFDNLRRLAGALMVGTDYLLGRVDVPDMAAAGDPLFRHMANITGEDRTLAEDFLKMLADRNAQRNKGDP